MTIESPFAVYSDSMKSPFPGDYPRPSMYVAGGPPPTLRSGSGYQVVDEHGNALIDFNNNFTSNIHGHLHPEVMAAVNPVWSQGFSFGLLSGAEKMHAEVLLDRVAGADAIKYTASGTEAVMNAVRVARAVTGRDVIIAIRGAFHGYFDPLTASQGEAGRRGLTASSLETLVLVDLNDTAALAQAVDQHGSRLAAILVDPMPNYAGLVALTTEFVADVTRLAKQAGALVIFDEVVNFRQATGGMQSLYGVTPDLTAVGKLIGGGFPLGAVIGKSEVMEGFNPDGPNGVLHGGTYAANVPAVVAGRKALELLDESAISRINTLGDRLRDLINRDGTEFGWEARGSGSLVRLVSADGRGGSARNHSLWWAAYRRGVLMTPTCLLSMSTPMTVEVIGDVAEHILDAMQEIR